jgi:hypothetical protein
MGSTLHPRLLILQEERESFMSGFAAISSGNGGGRVSRLVLFRAALF